MIELIISHSFETWVSRLRDRQAIAHITRRLDRLSAGNPGDVRPVGEGVSEMRIDAGPGYRIYYLQRTAIVIVLLCGGDKASQDRDIAEAKRLARQWKGAL